MYQFSKQPRTGSHKTAIHGEYEGIVRLDHCVEKVTVSSPSVCGGQGGPSDGSDVKASSANLVGEDDVAWKVS